jgi:lipoprotein-releasing system ATP-binding protein
VTLDGRNPVALGPAELAAFRNTSIGFVFQDHCLLPQCTVLENVLIPTLVAPAGALDASGGQARGASREDGRNAVTQRARELIDQVGLGDRVDHRPAELSGGERQRVAIARALIRQPRLVLCDEPTGNLDRASAENVAALLVDLHRGQRTMLVVVTHSPALASKFQVRFELVDRRLEARGWGWGLGAGGWRLGTARAILRVVAQPDLSHIQQEGVGAMEEKRTVPPGAVVLYNIYMNKGAHAEAAKQLRTFLKENPNAQNAAEIKAQIEKLQGK